MNQLENMGYWVHEKKGRENIYQPTSKKFNELDLSSINFNEEELNAWRATHFPDADIIEPGESFYVEKVEKATIAETEPKNTPITQIEHKSDSSIKHDATKN
jgi:hypothetical protein